MKPQNSTERMRSLIEAARGRRPCDTVLRDGLVLNVFTGEILRADVGIQGGRIAVVSPNGGIKANDVIHAENLILSPGLIDGHMHLESTMLAPEAFAHAALPLGTTAVVIDPHEIANVAGVSGIRELLAACRKLPLRFYLMAPPAVPASAWETSGARIGLSELASLADEPEVLGIGEEMDDTGVLEAREEVLAKLLSMPGRVADGHAPGLSNRSLQAYVAAGISSDHESTTHWEALEKLRAGMYLMIRESSAARDLDELIGLVDPNTERRCLLVTDDLSAADLLDRGHMNYLLKRTVSRGISPFHAIRMATLNTAQRFKVDSIGAIAPGYLADIVALEDLSDFRAAFVVAGGELVAADGEMIVQLERHRFSPSVMQSVHLPSLTLDHLAITDQGGAARVIEAADGRITTRQLLLSPASLSGLIVSDTDRDILKIAVVERHGKSGSVAVGLVNGFGLKRGAIASSVAHDSHNVVAVGASDSDMLFSIQHVGEMGGGLVVVAQETVLAELPLPVAGLMSSSPAATVARYLHRLEEASRDLGCQLSHAFMTLSFMCLSTVPELRITDHGLIDVSRSEVVAVSTGDSRGLRAA